MEGIGLWVTPLILLPGVGMLILSTSMRYGQIHEEFHRLQEEGKDSAHIADHLMARATLFRNALVSLYSSAAIFAMASLLGGLASFWWSSAFWVVATLTCVGIVGILFSTIQLVRESTLSLSIIHKHCSGVRESRTDPKNDEPR